MRVLLLCLLWLPLAATANERILDFHSDILVLYGGWIEVTETIRFTAAGDRIRRGIYRDFPTTYEDRLKNDYVGDFEIISLYRN